MRVVELIPIAGAFSANLAVGEIKAQWVDNNTGVTDIPVIETGANQKIMLGTVPFPGNPKTGDLYSAVLNVNVNRLGIPARWQGFFLFRWNEIRQAWGLVTMHQLNTDIALVTSSFEDSAITTHFVEN